jgi:hypothetical protein
MKGRKLIVQAVQCAVRSCRAALYRPFQAFIQCLKGGSLGGGKEGGNTLARG